MPRKKSVPVDQVPLETPGGNAAHIDSSVPARESDGGEIVDPVEARLRDFQTFALSWGFFSEERTSKTCPFRGALTDEFMTFYVPPLSTNRDVVELIAKAANIPIETLADELGQVVFSREATLYGYPGSEIDIICRGYENIRWWVSDVGLNMVAIPGLKKGQGAIPSGGMMGAPVVVQQMNFYESWHALSDAPDEVKEAVRGLAHAAIYAVTRCSSVPQAQVDDWLDRLIRYEYSWETMEDLLRCSQDHLSKLRHDEIAAGSVEQAGRLHLLAADFGTQLTFLADLRHRPTTHPVFPVPAPEIPARVPAEVITLAVSLKAADSLPTPSLKKMYEAVVHYNWYHKELSALKIATKKYKTAELLKKQFPELEIWAIIDKQDGVDIAAGDFLPGQFAWSLVQRLNGRRGRDDRSLQNYRKKLRAAYISF